MAVPVGGDGSGITRARRTARRPSRNPVTGPAARQGHDVKDEAVACLSSLPDRHFTFLGRYLFHITASGPAQGLRPTLRDPDAVDPADEGTEG